MNETKRILVPVDFSDCSLVALAKAWALADQLGSDVHLLHALSEPSFPSGTVESQRSKTVRLQEKLDRLMPPRAEMQREIAREVRIGNPRDRIVDYANQNEIDLIVMGTHGRTGVLRSVLGSVADRVVRSASCPVMTVPVDASRGQDSGGNDLTSIDATVDELPPGLDLLRRAVAQRATDIHADPAAGHQYEIRLRIDGRLEHYCHMDRDVAGHLIGQLKTLADLPIAEPFQTLEGRLRLPAEFSDLEARITAAPVAGGEAIAIRIFDRAQVFLPLDRLGFDTSTLQRVQEMNRCGEGIVLITGPTNSGKTTTVYSMLEALGDRNKNIVSVEDPVEMSAPFIRQMSVNPTHGITMAKGLRTILRMDPDVVFVGEIRDSEAAEMAMRAASSGKYVFSTLHTRDVAATVTALRDLGIDNRSIAANLTGIVNQRLIRRACKECAVTRPANQSERDVLVQRGIDLAADSVLEAKGCEFCRETGYRGRVGVFEAALLDQELRAAIGEGMPEDNLRAMIRRKDTPSLTEDAMAKASNLVTTASEALELRWL